MNPDEHKSKPQSLRELEWLAHYFKEHAREDLAQEIFDEVKQLRRRAQNSLKDDGSQIIDLNDVKRKKA